MDNQQEELVWAAFECIAVGIRKNFQSISCGGQSTQFIRDRFTSIGIYPNLTNSLRSECGERLEYNAQSNSGLSGSRNGAAIHRAGIFQNLFDSDLIWRRKKLSDMKAAIKAADKQLRAVLLRALITMSYAHWEGYVRSCANWYFEHLILRKRPFSDFERHFYINSFLARLETFSRSGTSIESRCKLAVNVLDGGGASFSYVN